MFKKTTEREEKESLNRVFNPQRIAVIGASDKPDSVGSALMKNILGNNYRGVVYPVNPKRETVYDVKAYPAVGNIPDKIDLAIIATPAVTVPGIAEECGRAGVAGLVIISSGFDEIGEKGKKMSNDILVVARRYGIRIIGPNCLGFIRPSVNLNASFAGKMALPGRVAFISQSGAFGASILDWSVENNIGFSGFFSIGSSIDISFADLIDYLNNDPETESIVIYMESLKKAPEFIKAARSFSRKKPIVVLKVGQTEAGSRAAKSHTGAITGNDAVYDAAFASAGVIRVSGAAELFNAAKILARQNLPAGNRVAVVTNAGGPGVIAADRLSLRGGRLVELSSTTVAKLKTVLPASASTANPVDILGDADSWRYAQAVELCLNDKNVDAVLVILTPQAMTDSSEAARQIISLKNEKGKTILASWIGGGDVSEGRAILESGGIPVCDFPEEAIDILMYLNAYRENIKTVKKSGKKLPGDFRPKTEKNRKMIENILSSGRKTMTELEAKEFIANYGIPAAKSGTAVFAAEAGKVAGKVGFPAVMKILSPDIMHKTDVGGVKLNINSQAEAEKAFKEIMKSVKQKAPKAKIDGVFIETMAKKRYELLLGCKKDEIFGPAIVFGLGGIAVEIFRDTAIALPPLDMSSALRLMEKTKIYKLLKGYRGQPSADIEKLQILICKFSRLITDFPEIKELDINPFSADEEGGVVLDAKIVLE